MDDAMDYFKDHYVMLESDYQYTSGGGDDSTHCKYSKR